MRPPASFSLNGRPTLVVGASGGIGAAAAQAMAAAGARLALAGRSARGLGRVRSRLISSGAADADVVTVAMDVRDPRSIDSAVDYTLERLGGVEILVVAMGISPIFTRAENVAISDWDDIFQTNTRGAFLVAQSVGRQMLRRRRGSVIFVSSVHATVGAARLVPYSASKAALGMMARSLALEWATRGVRVNTVAPGYVATQLTAGLRGNATLLGQIRDATPMGRLARPDEIAGAIVYLASDAAAYVTGSTLYVDGGWTAR